MAEMPESQVALERIPGRDFIGSTALFFRVKPGILLKAPVTLLKDRIIRERTSVLSSYRTERLILERLGNHPRIIE
jgi:hypothetical protein